MFIHIVAIAWLYVALLMAVTEGTSTQGSVLGAIFTFLLYGALPIALVLYVLATPARKRARKAREAAEDAEAAAARTGQDLAQAPSGQGEAADPTAITEAGNESNPPDQRREAAAGGAIAAERKET